MGKLKVGYKLEYLAWFLLGLLIFVMAKISFGIFDNPLFFSIAFFYIIFLPGWLLNRFLRISFKDLISEILIYFVVGLGFYFVVNLLAIFSGINIGILSKIVFIIIVLLFFGAFIYDWLKPSKQEENINHIKIKDLWQLENIYYLIPLIIGIFILYLVKLQGPNLNGDPYFHLAIVRKALDGDSLSIRELALTKTSIINPAYLAPVWHVFIAFLSRIFSVSIFTTWANVLYLLTVFVFLTWYYFSKVIFQKKSWTILALILMMIFVVYGGPAYLFARLNVPDTLAQLLLLPLALGISLQFIFESNQKKYLFLVSLISLMLLVLHGPHYFYLIISIFFFGLFFAIFYFKDQEYILTLKRIGQVLLSSIIILVLTVTAIEFCSQSVIPAIVEFNKAAGAAILSINFSKLGLVYKYGYFLLPVVLVLSKSKRIMFIVVSMLLTPLIYWTPLKEIFTKLLSNVFTDRLLANTSLYFFVFTVVLVLFLILIDRLFNHLSLLVRYLINTSLSVIFIILIILECQSHKISDFTYQIFYAKSTAVLVNNYWFIFLVGGIILAAILFLLDRHKSFIKDTSYKNNLTIFLVTLIVSFVLITPTFVNATNLKKTSKSGENYFLRLINNDQEALAFIQKKIPAKSVILTSGNAAKGLLTLTNQYMAYNVGSAYEKKFEWVFDSQNPDEVKLEIVNSSKWQIDYIYLVNPKLENLHFQMHPEQYELIYANKTEIYRLIK